MVEIMPKPYRYTVIYGENQLLLTTDPKGWQEHSIGFTRSDDFGLNVESVIALAFAKEGRNLLRGLYETTGIFTKAYLLIEKRNNDWEFDSFYRYRLDFTTYIDSMNYIEISGIEEGLLSAFSAYKDTEYEIDLPTVKEYITFEGINIENTNLIQCLYGEIEDYEKTGILNDAYLLKGERSIRYYSEKFIFTDAIGLPYPTMTVRALKNSTENIIINLNLQVIANGFGFNPASGTIKLVKHNSSYASPTIIKSYTPNTTQVSATKRTDTFSFFGIDTVSVTVNEGDLISLVYYAESNKTYTSISIKDSFDSYLKIISAEGSEIDNKTIEVFTYEWLIEELVKKISYPIIPVFISTIIYEDYIPMLTATPCIKKRGKLKVKLSDVLKSFDALNCIGIDLSSNIIKIMPRNEFYENVDGGSIECRNIILKHDTKHQFNKFEIGYDIDKEDDDNQLVYPFLCKKTFEISNTTTESSKDIVNPFMSDPYSFEKFYKSVMDDTSNKNECKFFIFSVKERTFTETLEGAFNITPHTDVQWTAPENWLYLYPTPTGTEETPFIPINLTAYPSNNGFSWIYSAVEGGFRYDFVNEGFYRIKIHIKASTHELFGEEIPPTFGANLFSQEYFSYKAIRETNGSLYEFDYDFIHQSYADEGGDYRHITLDMNILSNDISSLDFDIFDVSISYLGDIIDFTKYELNKDTTYVNNFLGDASEIYNIPLTPKRIMNKHLGYLSISNYGNNNNIKFINSDFNASITSIMSYEETPVIENADVPSIAPIFLPITIECDTVTDLTSTFTADKYKYLNLFDKKSGKVYQGWINSVTFAPTKNKSTKLILQAKSI